MKPIDNYEQIQASENTGAKPAAGGYVFVITKAEDRPDKEYVYLEFDFAEGDHAGYCSETYSRFARWPALGRSYRSYKPAAVGMFKSFTDAVEASNKRFKWDWNESKLVGKIFGGVLGEEEFLDQNGDVKVTLKLSRCLPADAIRAGEYKIPKRKEVRKPDPDAFTDITPDDCPF